MTAAKIARTTKDIFNYALNINRVREFNYSHEGHDAVDALSIRFVDAIDDADNDGQRFYDDMRSRIRDAFTAIDVNSYLNRDDDEAFFTFYRALERIDSAAEFLSTALLIRDTLKRMNYDVMANS